MMTKKYVIVDIDGTLSNAKDRLYLLKLGKPNWNAFYDGCDTDQPIQPIVDLVKALDPLYQIIFCTGRHDKVLAKTLYWIEKHFGFIRPVLMRRTGDVRQDVIIKPELLVNAGIPFDEIAFILEDRNSMVKEWRDLGLTCLQVAEGDF